MDGGFAFRFRVFHRLQITTGDSSLYESWKCWCWCWSIGDGDTGKKTSKSGDCLLCLDPPLLPCGGFGKLLLTGTLNRDAKRMLPALRFHVGMHEPACEREAEVAGLGT